MRQFKLLAIVIICNLFAAALAKGDEVAGFLQWAPTPPMGWNSWDCYGTAVNEAQTKANADYMADHLANFGWQYVVVDIQWYQPTAKGWDYQPGAKLEMDGYGRLIPAVNRFPSAADGNGFKALADYVHSKGLKFGIHILRGIPRQAVVANLPILGTSVHAADIADQSSTCAWNPDMFGINVNKPGGQEYYNSLFAMYADWGVNFVKVDDLSRPYHKEEIAAIRRAIDLSGQPIVFSTSPGATALDEANDIAAKANMWRISDDFWDSWDLLKPQFQRCADWAQYSGHGHYPDADMLPFGMISHGLTNFTKDEQHTVMTLWSISRSPLIFGGDLPRMDDFTLSLLTNDEVIAVDQRSQQGRQLFRKDDLIAWSAGINGSSDQYLAVFNARDHSPAQVAVSLKDLGFNGPCAVRDLWKRTNLGTITGEFSPTIAAHGTGLYRITPVQTPKI